MPYIIHDWNRLLLAPSYSSDFPYLGRKAFALRSFSCPFLCDVLLQWLHQWSIIPRVVSGMDFRQCQTPCSRLILSDNQHRGNQHRLSEAMAWSLDPGLEAMESEQFSLSLPPSTERHRADSGNGFLCNPGWRIFCLPWPPTPRISELCSSMLSHIAARRRGIPQPIQSWWMFWRVQGVELRLVGRVSQVPVI